MRAIIFIIAIIILTSCATDKNKNKNKNAVNQQNDLNAQIKSEEIHEFDNFTDYLRAIPSLKLPFKYDSKENIGQTIDIKSKYRPEGATIIGKLNSIDDRYLIIYRYPADILLPILEIYNNQGKKIKQFELLDLAFCTDESGKDFGKFVISNDSTIILENYKIENNDTSVMKTTELNLNKIIKN